MIKGGATPGTRGTAFYYISPTRYGVFDTAAVQDYFNNTFGNGASTLNNLKLKYGTRFKIVCGI